ncbi:DEAD/DEAH box helicase [Kineococcus sp. SYSU DK002]|uniref:DEAD/DEAH box helicase n=1 Tax=Kineococcus sp. SYSU DK002 TaxID=3383123 RepID=UPI003D7CA174
MRLIDRVRRRRPEPSGPETPTGFRQEFGRYTRFTADPETLSLVRAGQAGRRAQEQYYVLDLLCDDGQATDLDDGFAVSEDVIAGLDALDAAVLGLPSTFDGRLEARVHRYTASPDFRVELDVLVGAHPTTPDRRGPVLRVGGELHRLPTWALKALRAVEHHRSAGSPRSEDANVRLVAELQTAKSLAEAESPGSSFSLGALDRFTTVVPTSVGLTVEPQPDGSLTVEPDLGPGVDASAAATRWHQVEGPSSSGASDEAGVLRIDDTLVLLEEQELAAVREVRQRSVIPAADVRAFLEAPGSFYDPELVDVDVRFSVRVAGLGVIAPVSFEQAASTGLDWFAGVASRSTPELLVQDVRTESQQASVETAVEEAWNRGDTVLPFGDTAVVDISDRSHVHEVLAASRRRLAALSADTVDRQEEPRSSGRRVTVGMHILDASGTAKAMRSRAAAASPTAPIDFSQLLRQPFAHQRVGAEWMAGLLEAALTAEDGEPARIQGALLADDMGLGKTYMTLVALAEAQRVQRRAGRVPLPTLSVMPVALLENWLAEIRATFGNRCGPFDDVVVLQGSGLADYQERGAERETAARLEDLDENGMVRADRIHASLRIGPAHGEARLDRPGVLVLTTYETLRRYQVSLGLVDWGVVVMDEAQAVKNPEILATRAAKALKARFKLLATGTPVENSLRDFWTLGDTAQPGLLSSWGDFQEAWVQPMSVASGTEHERLGKALRDEVGAFMLRRVKEDHLEDLPGKHVHEYRQVMPAA